MRTLATLSLLALTPLTGCTLGQVEWGGDPLVGATVEFENCHGDTWQATTDGYGYYVFDGYADSSQALDEDVYLLTATSGGYERVEMVHVGYEPCPYPHEDKLCSMHDVDFGFRPMSGWEWSLWHQTNNDHNDITAYSFRYEVCRWRR